MDATSWKPRFVRALRRLVASVRLCEPCGVNRHTDREGGRERREERGERREERGERDRETERGERGEGQASDIGVWHCTGSSVVRCRCM